MAKATERRTGSTAPVSGHSTAQARSVPAEALAFSQPKPRRVANILEQLRSAQGRANLQQVQPGEARVTRPAVDRLPAAESYARYQTLVERVRDAFGDGATASLWLSTASRDFDGRPPIQIAMEDGYSLNRLEPVLARIEHGIDF